MMKKVHFLFDQAMALSKQLHAKQTYVVGMNCDAFPPHDEMNQRLQQQQDYHNVQLAHDGLVLNL